MPTSFDTPRAQVSAAHLVKGQMMTWAAVADLVVRGQHSD